MGVIITITKHFDEPYYSSSYGRFNHVRDKIAELTSNSGHCIDGLYNYFEGYDTGGSLNKDETWDLYILIKDLISEGNIFDNDILEFYEFIEIAVNEEGGITWS